MHFTDILQQFNIPYKQAGEHHHCSAGWIQLDCPYCSRDSAHFRLGYNLAHAYLNCWTCGSQHLPETLHELTGRPWHEIQEMLGSIDQERPKRQEVTGKLTLPAGLGPLRSSHRHYLQQRGFDPEELVKLWDIRGIGLAAQLAWRIWIPIHQQGRVVSWTTRSIADQGRRYVSAKTNEETLPARSLLYGEDYARHAIVVCEGPVDCWRIGPGAVATLGLTYTPAQLARMVKYPIRAVCYDHEPIAQQKAKRLCEALEAFPGRTYNILLDAKDPGSASDLEIQEIHQHFLI